MNDTKEWQPIGEPFCVEIAEGVGFGFTLGAIRNATDGTQFPFVTLALLDDDLIAQGADEACVAVVELDDADLIGLIDWLAGALECRHEARARGNGQG